MDAERLLRLPAVESHIGLRRTKIYDMVRARQFPAPIKFGRVSMWLRSEVTNWMDATINAAR
jgi:prophage regulatory protein